RPVATGALTIEACETTISQTAELYLIIHLVRYDNPLIQAAQLAFTDPGQKKAASNEAAIRHKVSLYQYVFKGAIMVALQDCCTSKEWRQQEAPICFIFQRQGQRPHLHQHRCSR